MRVTAKGSAVRCHRGRVHTVCGAAVTAPGLQGVEATLFATLMSVNNSGMFVGNALGSALTAALGVTADTYDNLALLITLCTLSALLPLPLLRLLPEGVDKDADGEAGSGEAGGGPKEL